MTDRLYTIRAGLPFVDLLARGLLDETAGDPLRLSGYTVLLPTRRACRALREAFLRVGEGKALLLPAMRPLGEVDEEELILVGPGGEGEAGAGLDLPPVIPELRRRLILARLIVNTGVQADLDADGAPVPIGIDHAARLAVDLARLIDQVQTERLDFARLESLVQGDLARHWERTLKFLKVVTEHWPSILAELGHLDPAERRNRLLAAQTATWQAAPPPGPVIAAGSTGSLPATADLLAAIAALPQGRVVLPGFDRG
ncbi:MAG: double-strand break repair protein AddB, partial [Alphaproteobacteria bacterium]